MKSISSLAEFNKLKPSLTYAGGSAFVIFFFCHITFLFMETRLKVESENLYWYFNLRIALKTWKDLIFKILLILLFKFYQLFLSPGWIQTTVSYVYYMEDFKIFNIFIDFNAGSLLQKQLKVLLLLFIFNFLYVFKQVVITFNSIVRVSLDRKLRIR